MARAENQGLQIALIVFVMLTIVLGVTTFLYFRSYEEAATANKTLAEASVKDKKITADTQTEINNIKTLLGVDQQMQYKEIDENFKNDMKQFAATLPADKQHYRQALESLFNSYSEMSAQLAASQDNVKQLQAQLVLRDQERDKQIAKFKEDFNAKAKDAEGEQAKYNDEVTSLKASQSELVTQKEAKGKDLEDARAEAAAKEAGLTKENAQLAQENIDKGITIQKQTNPAFEVADGLVVNVNPSTHMLYVNLGRGEHLRPLVTFSVHDARANTKLGKGLKGKIEITKIVNEHLALGRILDEDYGNPITEGDKIYSPLWQAGQQQHFAILGTIDLDGDGKDDRELVKDLITANDGVIDAEMDEQGKVTGKITEFTRYLIEGTTKDNLAIGTSVSAMKKDASIHGTELIPAVKFFELSGWKNPQQVFRMGPDGTRENLPVARPDGGLRTNPPQTSAKFQKRRPWSPEKATGTSAYGEQK
ncbi:MAG: hypothetical protein HYX69_20155 [Planctomycetia bacterium]|nr:hypothetical protein [Planctomycetia bacterium]